MARITVEKGGAAAIYLPLLKFDRILAALDAWEIDAGPECCRNLTPILDRQSQTLQSTRTITQKLGRFRRVRSYPKKRHYFRWLP
jgi:hypothetical protein